MIRPWEEEPERYSHSTRWNGIANCVREPIEDERTGWKRGDIIKFGSGYFASYDYKDWFLDSEDKAQRLKRDKRVPIYAFNQYAILMTRYRVVKRKHGDIFRDYGSHIMMITGPKIGHMRRFYVGNPFEHVGSFPYNTISDYVKNIIDNFGMDGILNELYRKYGNTSEARTLFVSEFQDRLSEENT